VSVCVVRTLSEHESQLVSDRLRQSLVASDAERRQLGEARQSIARQLDQLSAEHQRLQTTHADLQRRTDHLLDDKDDLSREQERQNKERDRWSVRRLLTLWFITLLGGVTVKNAYRANKVN